MPSIELPKTRRFEFLIRRPDTAHGRGAPAMKVRIFGVQLPKEEWPTERPCYKEYARVAAVCHWKDTPNKQLFNMLLDERENMLLLEDPLLTEMEVHLNNVRVPQKSKTAMRYIHHATKGLTALFHRKEDLWHTEALITPKVQKDLLQLQEPFYRAWGNADYPNPNMSIPLVRKYSDPIPLETRKELLKEREANMLGL